MDPFFNNISQNKVNISILATYALVRSSLESLLGNDRRLYVFDAVGTAEELMEKISHREPDVVLICLTENEGKNISVAADLLKTAPRIKVIILSNPNSLLDHSAALKLGVAGIVGTNQSGRVLIQAIRQVAGGEVWLNQKLISELLSDSFNSSNSAKNKNKLYSKGGDLTKRELEVVGMIGLGLTNKDISKKLHIGETTVRHHLSSIYSKLDVEDRLNLAIYAYRQGIVSPRAKLV